MSTYNQLVLSGFDDRSVIDGVLDVAEGLKELWLQDVGMKGPLNDIEIEGFTFNQLEQTFLYEPDRLAELGEMCVLFDVVYVRHV